MKHERALAQVASKSVSATDFSGLWENELGSTMDLTVDGVTVRGVYKSAVSGGGGPIVGDIFGTIAGQVISFFVNWQNGSITTWIGHQVEEEDAPVLETLWFLGMTTSNPDDPEDLWDSVFTGADRFYQP